MQIGQEHWTWDVGHVIAGFIILVFSLGILGAVGASIAELWDWIEAKIVHRKVYGKASDRH